MMSFVHPVFTAIVDVPGVDVFGNLPAKKQLECVCPNCKRNLAASRFAPHLEKCMGMGRNSSRIASRRSQKVLKDDRLEQQSIFLLLISNYILHMTIYFSLILTLNFESNYKEIKKIRPFSSMFKDVFTIKNNCNIWNTVKPVYNSQPWGLTKVAFVGRCSEHILYIKVMLLNILLSLLKLSDTQHDRQKYHCSTHESQLQVLHKLNLWYSMSTFTSPNSLFLWLKTATSGSPVNSPKACASCCLFFESNYIERIEE